MLQKDEGLTPTPVHAVFEFSDTTGEHRAPEWRSLAWIDARAFVVVDKQGVAWDPSGVTVQGANPYMPLG